MPVLHGRTATLSAGFETSYRNPGSTPQSQILKFSTLEIGQEAVLEDDPTINANPLAEKRTEMDSSASATVNAIICLNEIGLWLKLLLGPPVTTGGGPIYTHTYTLSLAARPSSWFEVTVGETPDQRLHRFLGVMLNQMSWDVMANAQSFTANLLGAVEVKPQPTTALDLTPSSRLAKRQACTKRANIFDVSGASTLGRISGCTIQWSNDLTPYSLADGQEGTGEITLGQPSVSGSISGLFENGTLFDHALTHASKKLVIVQGDSSGTRSLTTTIQNIEFDRPKLQINTSKGLVVEGLPWRAHHVSGAAAVTVVLTNDIPAYP